MEENTPKRKGRKPNKTTEIARSISAEKPATKSSTHGGAREGAGSKQKYMRVDVTHELMRVNFKIIQEYLRLYAVAIEKEDTKLQKEILDTLIRYAASPFAPTPVKGEEDSNPLLDIIAALSGAKRPPPKGS